MFNRIAIVNRGEAAMRLIHGARELSAELGVPMETVALHVDEERTASFVRAADRDYPLGPAAARPYLDYAVLRRALLETGADAAWAGWGFVSEDPAFVELCEEIGVTFIGPTAATMRTLGDKIGAKQLAEQVGVPVAPWSGGAVADVDTASEIADRIGYPVLVKAAAGGGGRGIRMVHSRSDLVAAFDRTRQEAQRSFGNAVVLLEQQVTGARHVEVQILGDGCGAVWALGVRDCSVQRRYQKLVEESASVLLDLDQVTELKAAAERLAAAVSYRGAGTVEFLYQPEQRRFAFLEVNTRLQVEHPVTELTTGIDLVKAQIRIAAGERLVGDPPVESGHAVEVRLNAEDPDRDFAAAPGRLARFDIPGGPGVRVDTGMAQGDTIPAMFDSMIAKIIAHGRDRDEALARLRWAVAATGVLVEGGVTNKSFLLELLSWPEFVAGQVDTGGIDRARAGGDLRPSAHAGVALAVAAVTAYQAVEASERERFFATLRRPRTPVAHGSGRGFDLKLRDTTHRVMLARLGADRYRVSVDGSEPADFRLEWFDQSSGQVVAGQRTYALMASGADHLQTIEVDGVAHRVSQDEGGVLRAPAPSLVVATPVEPGTEVAEGEPVLVLESMKMETVLYAPFSGVLRERMVAVGSNVETGAALARLKPTESTTTPPAVLAPGAVFEPDGSPGQQQPEQVVASLLADLKSLLLGYDIDPNDLEPILKDYQAAPGATGEALIEYELSLVQVFADLCELNRNKPVESEAVSAAGVRSPREHFHSFLQHLNISHPGFPASFTERLARVFRQYGVTASEHTSALEQATFRISLAQGRADAQTVVIRLLERWLAEPAPTGACAQHAGQVLEQLARATQLRAPVLSDLARRVEFHWFTQPMLRRTRAEAYAAVRKHLRYLDQHPDAPTRGERIADLVNTTEPLIRLLKQRLNRPGADLGTLLEVLTRRYYRTHGLQEVRLQRREAPTVVTAHCGEADRPTVLVATVAEFENFAEVGKIVDAVLDEVATGNGNEQAKAVLDLYLRWPGQPDNTDAMADRLREALADLPMLARVARVTILVTGASASASHYHFTFHPGTHGPVESALIRGVHPVIAERLELWRLRRFSLTKLPSPDEEVCLYQCVAPDNPTDERLVAMAQVRDLTPLRDRDGNLKALPSAEGTLIACVEAIRRVQAQRGAQRRLDTNRVFIYVLPPSELAVAELQALARRMAPATAGAGIEEVLFIGAQQEPGSGQIRDAAVRITHEPGIGLRVTLTESPREELAPRDDYNQRVRLARRRGLVYPYELTEMLAGPGGTFVEYDLDCAGTLLPVDRPKGHNHAGIVVGVARTPTERYPDGMSRVVLMGDPTNALGALARPECTRVIAALDLAEELGMPVEWFTVSAGARIAMDSGTENLDWVARVLAHIVKFTQRGGEINVIVAGINAGAQPYWNAEATMLMHTKGILVMTPDSAMVLTGKQSLDFSGSVSAEDNFGIGGYERVMGPNGQAQYWAADLTEAHQLLMAHYDHTYIVPGECLPRRAVTADPVDRDVRAFPHQHPDSDFTTVGEIFAATTNAERKKPFDIRTVLRAVSDQDHPLRERWAGMADAEIAVVTDARIGGYPVCLIGCESRPVSRRGPAPADGPETHFAGTLFPQSSKKVARGINAASGNRPLVILANLSGFDGSPESMRTWQLEYGAEIGRAIVNFRGPIVFCVVSRYHGGAFVVFSKALNPQMTVLAVEGSYASVIGGAPAAAVVFPREVEARTAADPRVSDHERRAAQLGVREPGSGAVASALELVQVRESVRAEKLSEVAAEFDAVHSVERAVKVGSVDAIIRPEQLRPEIIAAISRGLSSKATVVQP